MKNTSQPETEVRSAESSSTDLSSLEQSSTSTPLAPPQRVFMEIPAIGEIRDEQQKMEQRIAALEKREQQLGAGIRELKQATEVCDNIALILSVMAGFGVSLVAGHGVNQLALTDTHRSLGYLVSALAGYLTFDSLDSFSTRERGILVNRYRAPAARQEEDPFEHHYYKGPRSGAAPF